MLLYLQKLIQKFFFRIDKKKFPQSDNIKICREISRGSFGIVYMGMKNKKYYAIKILKKLHNKKNNISYQNEIDILNQLNHPNIIRYVGSYQKKDKIYIITEYYSDSDLFDKIKNYGGKINEKDAKSIIRQILQGVSYLHEHNIIHRDLKLSNIMFNNNVVKIIDFGGSVITESSTLLEDEFGTPGFIAPEVIQGCYNRECDMWAIGCITFIMLFGFNPFNIKSNNDKNEIYKNVLKGFRNEVLDGYGAFFPKSIKISFCARDFIVSLLTDKITRLNVIEALNHPWIIN